HDLDNPDRPGASMLGKQQLKWLKDGIAGSKADFIFVISSVNFMVPHVGSGGGDDKQLTVKKDDAWTVFLDEREELIEFWDELEKPVFVLTGDLHNSYSVKITDNVWEFASGPHNSINHAPMKDEGGRPVNGKFKYGPRECDIRWSTYAMDDIPRANRAFPHYCVVQVNNVFNNPVERDGERWFEYPHPQVMFQFFDAITGELRYSETIVKGLK
ncbi:alkaline phosphatase D family protein, partial [Verrucomicrobiales bacterium]|nr:alkaline phosphatase D family protein [Verrucomicrobiales bacterium]